MDSVYVTTKVLNNGVERIDNDEDKIIGDKTPVYYYTHLVGDKMDNLKEGDIDLIRVEPDKNMNDVEKML